jgi:hypothetical protein
LEGNIINTLYNIRVSLRKTQGLFWGAGPIGGGGGKFFKKNKKNSC